MTRRFTKILAAFALLVGLTIPLGMWGQTISIDFEGNSIPSGWTNTNDMAVVSNPVQTEATGSYCLSTNGKASNSLTSGLIENVVSISVDATRTTNNTTNEVYIDFCPNTSFGDSDTQSKSVTVDKNSWTTSTLTLSSTASGYVRIRRSGGSSTATKYIDNIVITTGGDTPTTYNVTVNQTTGGTIAVNPTQAAAGTTITLTATPAEGYSFGSWSITPNTVVINNNQFTMPASNVTVSASWTQNSGGGATSSATLTQSNLGLTGAYTTGTEKTINGITYVYTDLMKNNDNIQAKASTGTIKNTTAYPGDITSVVITHSGTARATTINGSADGTNWTQVATGSGSITADFSGKGYKYFQITRGSNAAYWEKVDITWSTESSTDPTITAADVEIAYDAEEGAINYTINNPVEGGSIVASCDAEWIEVDDTPQTTSTGSIDFICAPNSNFYAHSATVTLTYTYGDSKATVTKEVTVTQAKDPNANGSTAEYPITVSEALEAIDEVETVSDIYVGGIVSAIVDEYSSTYHNITFDMIDEDGDEYYLRAYRCVGTDGVNASEVAVGDEVVVYGTLFKYNNSIYEFQQGCQLVSLIHPAVPSITVNPDEVNVDAEEHDGTLDLTYQYLEIESFEDFDIQFYDAEGNELDENNEPDWIEVTTAEDEDVLLVSYFILENDGEARSAYFKVYAMDAETNLVYSNLVTVNQDEYVIPVEPTRYTLATTIESGRTYIITNGSNKAMGAQANNNRPASDVSIEYNDEIENYVASGTDVYEFAINGPDENGYYIIFDVKYDNKKGGYLYAASSSSNHLKTQSPNDDNGKWTISFGEDGAATIVAHGTNTNKYMRFNAGSNLFSCYGENSSITDLPYLYVKEDDVVRTYVTDITADKWYLISSPVGYVGGPQYVPNMTTNAYALYSFDQSEQKEWRNYKANNFDIEAGKGYLYASDNGCTLIFSAEPSGTGQYGGGEDLWLTYDENASFKGYNLIGNIYGEKVVVNNYEEPYATRQLYIMNPNSNEIIASDDNILQPMQGAFVIAEGAGEHVYFARFGNDDEVKKGDKFVLNLSQNRGNVIDRAIVRMGEGDQLPKFMLNEDNTKLYISQNGKDYAVVRSEGQGELPVNFRAAENGTYTLSIDTEDMDMNYLHLIDNMTGMDVDLLQTPSYTFEAKVNDYESRFRLVFAANNEDGVSTGSAAFAFYSNGNWIINNAGEATLQVVDLTGRILSSETVKGSVSKTINAVPGVYMLRLINGDNVNVQKIVVR